MSELLKIGGSTDNGTASGVALNNFGAVKTVQYPNKSYFLGSVIEPKEQGFMGAYGVMGLEVVASYPIRPINAYANANFADARNGHVAYIAKNGTDSYINFVDMAGSVSWSKKLRGEVVGEWVCVSITPTTIIALTNNGFYSVYDIKTAQVLFTGRLTVANAPNQLMIGSFCRQDSTHIYFAVDKGVIKASHDLQTITPKTWSEILTGAPEAQKVTGTALVGDNFYISASDNPSRIIVINKTDLSLLAEVNAASLNLTGPVPTVFAIGSTLYGLTTDNKLHKLKFETNALFIEATYEINGLSLDYSSRMKISTTPDGFVLVSSPTANTLFSATALELMWSLSNTVRYFGCFAAFDGYGHCILNHGTDKLVMVNNFLQVQGYGVKA